MKLIVFGISGVAYFVPNKIAKKVAECERIYHESIDSEKCNKSFDFIMKIPMKYKAIVVGHVLSGDIS